MGRGSGKFRLMKLIKQASFLLASLVLLVGNVIAAQDFLPPEQAFQVEATWLQDSTQIEVELLPAKGYYIYQNSLKFQVGVLENKLITVKPALPRGIDKFDETFQKKLQVYKQAIIILLEAKPQAGKPIYVEVELQGCAEAGICYPPMTAKLMLAGPGVKVAPIPEESEGAKLHLETNNSPSSLFDLWHERDDINAINRFFRKYYSRIFIFSILYLGFSFSLYTMRTTYAANHVKRSIRYSR